MNSDLIKSQLQHNMNFVKRIESLKVKIEIMSDNKRDMLLAGFSRNLLSHFLSINILIEKKLYNSAFALERIFFDNVIRLNYMYLIMNDTKISTIYDANSWDKKFPTIHKMSEKIDEKFDIPFYLPIKEEVYKIMNDYTHTGANQIARNFNELATTISSNFSEELILDTLKGNKALLKTSTVVYLEGIGLKNSFISEKEIKDFLAF